MILDYIGIFSLGSTLFLNSMEILINVKNSVSDQLGIVDSRYIDI